MLQVRFDITPPGENPVIGKHYYYVDNFEIEPHYEGDDFVYLDDAAEVEIRRMRMIFKLSGVPEGVSGTEPTWFTLWRSMIGNTDTVHFYPKPKGSDMEADDTANAHKTVVIGTSRHRPKVYGLEGGRLRRKTSLHFAEKQFRVPTDNHFDFYNTLIPNL